MSKLFQNLLGGIPFSRYLVGKNYSIPQGKYNNLGVGMFMHIMPDDYVNYGAYDKEAYYTENFDWPALAAQVASIGHIDYIIFRAKIERGFCHWPTQVKFNDGNSVTYNGVTVPQFGHDYNLGNSYYSGIGVTSDTIDRFMAAFKAVGITPCLDYPIGRDHNVRTDMSNTELQNSSSPAIYGMFDEYHEYVKAHLLELIDLYAPEILWLDNETKHPWVNNLGQDVRWQNHQDIYSAIKAKKKDIILMGNLNVAGDGGSLYTGGKIQYFPQDVISQESAAEVPDAEYVDDMVHDGSPYKVPKERLWDGLFADNRSVQYEYWDVNSPLLTLTNPNQIRTQQEFQDAYNKAKAIGATPNFNIGPIPASVGTNKHLIDPTYLARLKGIVY